MQEHRISELDAVLKIAEEIATRRRRYAEGL
jgi:hypothetical protein